MSLPPCFKRVYSNLSLVNRTHKKPALCLHLQCQIYMLRDGTLDLCLPEAQWKSSRNTHSSREAGSLNPISCRSRGQGGSQNARICGFSLLKHWGLGYQTVHFKNALQPQRSPALVLENSWCPKVHLVCPHSFVFAFCRMWESNSIRSRRTFSPALHPSCKVLQEKWLL